MQCDGQKNMSLRQYYKFLLHERWSDESYLLCNSILQGQKLMMEFVVMAFLREQHQKLRWIKDNQKKIRAETYNTLKDNVRTEHETGYDHGKRVILPASHYASVRWYRQKNLDSLAIVRKKGKPHLFITMTCNPNHPQILKALPHGASPLDRPDIVLRVFHQQVHQLLYMIIEGKVPGWERSKGIINVIEFQKRGLPHVHILAILDKASHMTDDEIDRYATAEIPNKEEHYDAWKDVVYFMLHKPCGDLNPDAPCCQNKYEACEHGFPKEYSLHSRFEDEDGSPVYRRRSPEQGGGSHSVNLLLGGSRQDYVYTSRDVVPHNLWLLKMFNCHINVEICSSLKVIKYLLWYPFKGEARVIASIEESGADEVKLFEDMRTVGATEAFWRFYEFPLHNRYPKVYSLDIHLEDCQQMYFEDTTILQDILQGEPKKTQLISFFEYNQNNGGVNTGLTYSDFPERLWYNQKDRLWVLRKNQNPGIRRECIGRLPYLTPDNGDVFYLRMLLCHSHCKGKKSFIELRTVKGVVYMTYLDTCVALGLLDDDKEWRKCLEGAELECSAARLRRLFATIIYFNTPSDVPNLLIDFSDEMGQDIGNELTYHGIDFNKEMLIQIVVILIEVELAEMDIEVSEGRRFGLQTLSNAERRQTQEVMELLNLAKQGEESYLKSSGSPYTNVTPLSVLQEFSNRIDTLTDEQRNFLTDAEKSLLESKQFCAFINADAGTGKTFTLNTLIARLIYIHKVQVISTAFSGIASTILLNGRTFHSQFKAKLKLGSQRGLNISKKSKLAESLKLVRFIIIDEAPQLHVSYYVDLDECLRDIMDNDSPFGGVSMVLAGDFKQTLPIVRRANQLSQVRACIKSSHDMWETFASNQYLFKENMRLRNEKSQKDMENLQDFQNFLNLMGTGMLPANNEGNIDLPEDFVVSDFDSESEMEDAAIDYVFGNINDHVRDVHFMLNNVILCPLNKSVWKINQKIVENLNTEEFVCFASDTPSDENPEVPVEYLNSLNVSGMPLFELRLKQHMPIMVIRNINKKRNICNGTRLIVEKVSGNLLYAVDPARNNEQVILPRIELESDVDKVGILWKRRQFPVYPAFAFSLNKSQGQTIFGRVGIFLYDQCFAHGQLYVASTRVIHPDHVKYFIRSKEVGARNVVVTQII